jgi:hypothetical protein
MLDVFAPRPAGDILSRSLRITLGETEFVLEVLVIAGNERWQAALDAKFNGLVADLEAAGNDTGAIYEALGDQPDALIDLLISYDTDGGRRPGVLPDAQAIKEMAHEDDLLRACREVWRAANPLVVMRVTQALAKRTAAAQESGASSPTSGSLTSTAGRRRRSGKS